MLEIKGLYINVGGFSLKDISLTVKDNECHVIIGPTGSGKTLLLESIIGFRRPLRGEIFLDNKRINDIPVEKRGFSYVPQDLALFPHLSVEENIYYSIKIKGLKDRVDKEFTDEIIEAVGIKHLMKRRIKDLSGGERQRVALLRSIIPGNKYLLLDEPLSQLHEGLKRELWFLVNELRQRYGLTILMVTHDIEEAFFLGDTISIVIDGKLHQTGRKSDVFRRPETIDVARYFGIKNLFDVEIVDINIETLTLYCAELNTNLTIPKRCLPSQYKFKTNDKLIAGIRAEDVLIPRRDLMRQRQDNLLNGTITDIFFKGASHIAIFQPKDSTRNIEIEIPAYAFQKLSLVKGQDASVSLRGENIFLVRSVT